MFGYFCKYLPIFKTSNLDVSNFSFLSLFPFHTKNANFTLNWFQNYNTHPAQNDIIFSINLKKKKKKKMKIGGGSTASLGVVEPSPCPKGWSDNPQGPRGALATHYGRYKVALATHYG